MLTTAERDELRVAARALLQEQGSQDASVEGEDRSFAPEHWRQVVELGWTGIQIPERFGGAGASFEDLAVVLHEVGRALSPLPLTSSVLAVTALVRSENDQLAHELIGDLIDGTTLAAVALASASGSFDPAQRSVAWTHQSGRVRLDGKSGFVVDAGAADALVVSAVDADGAPALVAVDRRSTGVEVEHIPTLDSSRRLATVTFAGVEVDESRLLCEPGRPAAELLDQILAVGVVAACSDAVGATEKLLELSSTYASERTQFGKPIGTFQAVKHHCADMALAVQAGRAAVRGAARALDGDPGGWPEVASVTASYVGPACSEACALGMRVHGGIGYTWEHPTHRHLKRVRLDSVLFGTPAWHRERIARSLLERSGATRTTIGKDAP